MEESEFLAIEVGNAVLDALDIDVLLLDAELCDVVATCGSAWLEASEAALIREFFGAGPLFCVSESGRFRFEVPTPLVSGEE